MAMVCSLSGKLYHVVLPVRPVRGCELQPPVLIPLGGFSGGQNAGQKETKREESKQMAGGLVERVCVSV
jgi:hypothetical protein